MSAGNLLLVFVSRFGLSGFPEVVVVSGMLLGDLPDLEGFQLLVREGSVRRELAEEPF